MGFEKFGVVSFTSQTKAAPFIDHLEKGALAGTRCKDCGTFFFPPRPDCFKCLSSNVVWSEIVGKGKLVSYSTLIYAPTGFEGDLPYTIALVEYDNKIKIFGRLSKEIKPEDMKIGMELTHRVVRLPNDRITYEFVKA